MSYLFKFRPRKGRFGFVKYFADGNGSFFKYFFNWAIYKQILLRTFRFVSPKRKNLTSEEEIFLDIFKNVFFLIIGGIGIYYGAKYVVPSAVNIAYYFKVPQDIVGIILLAIGTSLPELFVSLTALKKGLSNIMLGNIIGSNISNILVIGGISAMITPLSVNFISLYYAIPFMILMTLLLINFVRTNWLLRIFEGLLLFIMYVLFLISLIMFF